MKLLRIHVIKKGPTVINSDKLIAIDSYPHHCVLKFGWGITYNVEGDLNEWQEKLQKGGEW